MIDRSNDGSLGEMVHLAEGCKNIGGESKRLTAGFPFELAGEICASTLVQSSLFARGGRTAAGSWRRNVA